jgi:hypothetical protein
LLGLKKRVVYIGINGTISTTAWLFKLQKNIIQHLGSKKGRLPRNLCPCSPSRYSPCTPPAAPAWNTPFAPVYFSIFSRARELSGTELAFTYVKKVLGEHLYDPGCFHTYRERNAHPCTDSGLMKRKNDCK